MEGIGRSPTWTSSRSGFPFLRAYLRENWEVVQHAQLLDPALGFLSLLEKAERGAGL